MALICLLCATPIAYGAYPFDRDLDRILKEVCTRFLSSKTNVCFQSFNLAFRIASTFRGFPHADRILFTSEAQ